MGFAIVAIVLILYNLTSTQSLNDSFVCPSTFIVPKNVDLDDIRWVNNSRKCAFPCRSPMWTDFEWKVTLGLAHAAMWIGLPLDVFVFLTWTLDKRKRKQYFVIFSCLCSMIAQFSLVGSSFYTFEQAFCSSDAVPIGPRDGINLCNIQSFFALYGFNGFTMCWMLQAVDLYISVVLRKSYTEKFRYFNYSVIFGFPALLTILMGAYKRYGYLDGTTICFATGPFVSYLLYIPVLAEFVVGCWASFAVIWVILKHNFYMRRSMKGSASSSSLGADIMKMVNRSFLFLASFLIFTFPVEVYRLYGYAYVHTGATDSLAKMTPWVKCIFKHFDGVTDESWIPYCGIHPPDRVPFALSLFHALSAHGTALLIASTYVIQPSVRRTWYNWIAVCLDLRKVAYRKSALSVGSSASLACGSVEDRRRSTVTKPAVVVPIRAP